jgi:hypothetical protein
VSRDLDLFGPGVLDLEELHRAITTSIGQVEVLAITDATLQIKLEGLPVDLVRYRYPLLEPTEPGPEGTAVASRLDLASMKLAALAHRGLYRDFWDLHALLTTGSLTLDQALDAYRTRFGKSEPDLYHVLRSLTYFDDAENEPLMPAGMTAPKWEAVKGYFLVEAPAAFARRADLGA